MQRIYWASESPMTRAQREALEDLHGMHIPFLTQYREIPGAQTLCRFKDRSIPGDDVLYIADNTSRFTTSNLVDAAQRLGVAYRVFRSHNDPVVEAGNKPEHEIFTVKDGIVSTVWSKFKPRPQTAQAI